MQVSQEIAPRATKDCLSVEGLSPQADKADISIRGSASSITAPQIASSPPCEKTTPPPTTFKNENKMIRLQLIPWSIVPMHKPILNELIERRFHDGDVFKIGRQVNREGVPPPLEPPGPLDVWLTSKVVSRLHAEMGMKDGAVFFFNLDVC